jgi:chromosome segregation ATPase
MIANFETIRYYFREHKYITQIPLTVLWIQEQELKCSSQAEEMTTLKIELRHSHTEIERKVSTIVTCQKDLEKARQDKVYAEQRMAEALKRMEEAERHWKIAEKREKFASEAAEKARSDLSTTEKAKLESQRLAVERVAATERLERRCETLEREREELTQVPMFP